MSAREVRCALPSVLLLIAGVLGCEHRGIDTSGTHDVRRDPNDDTTSFLATWRSPDAATKERTHLALSKWQNGVTDHEPILLTASLVKPWKARPPVISLAAFDEDEDLLGFELTERYADGSTQLEEYPVYIHLKQLGFVDMRSVPAQIREGGLGKNESRWEEYIRGETIDQYSLKHVHNYYMDTMPPVLISVPEPNRVEVSIRVYDQAGNRSPAIQLRDAR